MSTLELVVFDQDGNEVDSVDPYQGHTQAAPGRLLVTGALDYVYDVTIPAGGRYVVRPMGGDR